MGTTFGLISMLFSISSVYAQVPNRFTPGQPARAAEVNANFDRTVTKDPNGAVAIVTVPTQGAQPIPLDVSGQAFDVLHLNNLAQSAVRGWNFGIYDAGLSGPQRPLGTLAIAPVGTDPNLSRLTITPNAFTLISSPGFDVLRLRNFGTGGPPQWNIGIIDGGQAGPQGTFFTLGTLTIATVGTDPGQSQLAINPQGQVRANSVGILSDARLKTNVTPLTQSLEKLAQIRSVSFEWTDMAAPYLTGRRDIGVIAQEVESVFPELVTPGGEYGYRAVDYGKLASVLIGGVNELRAEKDAQVAELEARLTTKDAQIVALEARLARLEQAVGNPSIPIESSISLRTDWSFLGGLLTAVGLLFGQYCRRR